MDVSAALFALAILHAGYLIQLCFRQPSNKQVSTCSESWIVWFAVSPDNMKVVRFGTMCLCFHHALISLAVSRMWLGDEDQLLHQVCPTPHHLDQDLFAFSKKSIVLLVLLYTACYIRFQAYAQLGTNFTYRIAAPDGLVTNGVYAYVRHPSYSGLFGALMALYFLFLTQHGSMSCWLPSISLSHGQDLIMNEKLAYLVPGIGFSAVIWLVMVKRVQEEEVMMEREFGQRWRDYCMRTKKFVPLVI